MTNIGDPWVIDTCKQFPSHCIFLSFNSVTVLNNMKCIDFYYHRQQKGTDMTSCYTMTSCIGEVSCFYIQIHLI